MKNVNQTNGEIQPDEQMNRLRRVAEQVVSGPSVVCRERLAPILPDVTLRLLRELQVHKIELEIQNAELRRTRQEVEESRARYQDLYDFAPVGYFTLDDAGHIRNANLTMAGMLGLQRTELVGQPLAKFICEPDLEIFLRYRLALTERAVTQAIQVRMTGKNDVRFWVRMEATVMDPAAVTSISRVVVSDITESKLKEDRLRQAAVMFDTAREGVIVTDADERILIVNPAFCQLTGYSVEELKGQSPSLLDSGRQDSCFYSGMLADVRATGYWQGEVWNRRKDGEVIPQLLNISAVRDERGEVIQYVGVFSDVTQMKEATARLDFLAHHDPLTGLPNRLLLFSRLEHCIDVARRERKSAALLMLDLDRFKDINDSFGHLAGDELLQMVALRLTTRLRGVDTVSRLGGDEFAVLLEDLSSPQDAAHVATEIIEALAEPLRLSKSAEVRIGTSIGISLFPKHGRSSEELLQQADAALYRAKSEGRGNFKYFSDDLTFDAQRRIRVESSLRRALQKHELRVHYQPQFDVKSGCLIGAEALVRWQSPTEGLIAPDQFIPVAEATGLISTIGEWVLREVCRQGRCWIAAGLPTLKLAVNLSTHQLRHGDINETIASILAETGFPADCLELELTESALMERQEEAVLVLQRFRDLGVRVAIDDFGTGYSSLAYLKRFPLDALKIDQCFINDIAHQQDDREITSAIIGMGHTLRLKVLAEGVETREQLDFLSGQGCDMYQGFFRSPAVPAEAFEAILRAGQTVSHSPAA